MRAKLQPLVEYNYGGYQVRLQDTKQLPPSFFNSRQEPKK